MQDLIAVGFVVLFTVVSIGLIWLLNGLMEDPS
jgi:hypothetical protein